MNSLLKFFSFSLAVVLLAACSATKPLTLDVGLENGANLDYTITTSSNLGMSMLGQKLDLIGQAVQDFDFLVKAVNPTGITDIDFKIENMAVDVSIPLAGDFSYDSQKGDNDSSSPFSSLGGLIGKTMSASLNKNGKVTRIEGADEAVKQVLGKIKGAEQAASLLEGFIGEDAFKSNFESITGFSQGGKVLNIGDNWSKSIQTKAGVTLNSDYTYTVKERNGGKVTIDVTGESKSDPNAAPIEAQGVKVSYNLAGPISGVIVVDEKTGWAITSDIQQDLSGKVSMSGTPVGDVNLDAKMTIGTSAKRN